MKTRIIFSNNGTLEDFTQELNKYSSGTKTFDYAAAEDSLFIGVTLPINHLYFKFGLANTANANMLIKIWDGNTFKAVAEFRDETNGFKNPNYSTWVPDRNNLWGKEDTVNSAGVEQVTGLGGITIYDKYWIKIDFSIDLDVGTTLSWLGHLFSDDAELGSEFPDLNRANTKAAFTSGKTDWEEQAVRAAILIEDDLKKMKLIKHESQILDRDELMPASIQKVAEIIYNSFGDDYLEQKKAARTEYYSRLKKATKFDRDNDGIVDPTEEISYQGRISRGPEFLNEGFN